MTFKAWVQQFKGQDHPYGDLAEDISRDNDFPNVDDKDVILMHLARMNACSAAIDTFEEMYDLYKK